MVRMFPRIEHSIPAFPQTFSSSRRFNLPSSLPVGYSVGSCSAVSTALVSWSARACPAHPPPRGPWYWGVSGQKFCRVTPFSCAPGRPGRWPTGTDVLPGEPSIASTMEVDRSASCPHSEQWLSVNSCPQFGHSIISPIVSGSSDAGGEDMAVQECMSSLPIGPAGTCPSGQCSLATAAPRRWSTRSRRRSRCSRT